MVNLLCRCLVDLTHRQTQHDEKIPEFTFAIRVIFRPCLLVTNERNTRLERLNDCFTAHQCSKVTKRQSLVSFCIPWPFRRLLRQTGVALTYFLYRDSHGI
jgi:hypothetical protein